MFPFKKGLWSLFLDRFQLPEGCRPTTWRQLLLTTESPVNPGAHLIDLGGIEGSLSWIGKPQRFLRNVLGSFFSFQLSGPTKLIFKRDQQINLGINGNTPHDMMKFHNLSEIWKGKYLKNRISIFANIKENRGGNFRNTKLFFCL